VRNAIHRLKYRRDIALGEVLARPMIECFQSVGWQVDLVTPVPLGVARYAERGYNQAALLARPLALSCGLRYASQALIKIKDTRSQVGLGIEQRRENVAGAFMAQNRFVEGRSVLVVDDVTTSGATLEACAVALMSAGAKMVYCLTLARARENGYKALTEGSS
jgi:ComF family protein